MFHAQPCLPRLILALVSMMLLGVPQLTWAQETGALPRIPLPVIPARIFKITDYGAMGDGKTLNTLSVRKAIEECSKAGGGTVLVPPGRFLTGPFGLASGINLRVEKGATLLLSNNPADYVLRNNGFENCIHAEGCHDVAITGSGTIDGQGEFWWKNYVKPRNAPPGTPNPPHRPFMVVLTRCSRVLIQDISLTNSPSFHLVPGQCQDVTVKGIRIMAPANSPNTDGMDPSGWNFLIQECTFDVGDDCIAIKPSGRSQGEQLSCENFAISNCTFLHGHGMSIGGQTPGGLRNLTVRNCTFQSTQAGIRMKANRGSGGLVENLSYENLTMKDVKVAILITSYYPTIPRAPGQDPAQPVTSKTPTWRHIRITNVTSEGGQVAGRIIGLAEMPVSDVLLTNVRITAEKGMEIVHAQGIRFVNSQLTAKTGPPIAAEDAQVTGMELSRGNLP